MKAKDTVMNWDREYEKAGCMENLDVDALLSRQAEISFKLGATQAIAKTIKPAGVLCEKAKQAGIREVVERIETIMNTNSEVSGGCGQFPREDLAKLKEWVIK